MHYLRYIIIVFLLLEKLNMFSQNYFPCGVASGDPLQDKVIVWTAINPYEEIDSLPIIIYISKDPSFENTIQTIFDTAFAKNGFTLKHDVKNLEPNTWYYYQFVYKGNISPIGRTKTAPENNTIVRFAMVSCSNYEHGFFNVYKNIVTHNDVDAIIHLGDYIYEFGAGSYTSNIINRNTFPEHEILTLTDYRDRYRHYRLDSSLQQLHQNFPMINIWDDHEIANDAYKTGAQNHSDSLEGNYFERLKNAKKAFYEWIPVREPNPHLYRKFLFGQNVNLLFLDTRIEGRDKQTSRKHKLIHDTTRRLIGDEQFEWLTKELSSDTNVWNIIAQQVMMSPFSFWGIIANTDQWDGYSYEKNRFFNYLNQYHVQNLVVLTGDLHSSWANEIPLKKGKKTKVGVEFITPSVTSSSGMTPFKTIIKTFNHHTKYLDLKKHGYISLTIGKDELISEFIYVDQILTPTFKSENGPIFKVKKGEHKLIKVQQKDVVKSSNPKIIELQQNIYKN